MQSNCGEHALSTTSQGSKSTLMPGQGLCGSESLIPALIFLQAWGHK